MRFTWHHRKKSIYAFQGQEFHLFPEFNSSYSHIDWLFWELWWFDEGEY